MLGVGESRHAGCFSLLVENKVWVVMPQSGSEPRFGPELLRTGPKSGSRFGIGPEPNPKSGSGFPPGGTQPRSREPRSDRTGPEPEPQ